MKKIITMCLLLLCTSLNAIAQYGYDYYDDYRKFETKGAYHKDLEFIVHGGILQSDLRYKGTKSLDIGIDYTPWESSDKMFSYSFITSFTRSSYYWSANPLGASAILLTLFCKNIVEDDEMVHTILMIAAGESMSFNFALTENFEVGPSWNLLRLSHRMGGSTYMTGAIGARANYYFGPDDRWSLRARGEYTWGYGNADFYMERLYNIFGDDGQTYYFDYEKPHTPFKGWSLGLSIGYRF